MQPTIAPSLIETFCMKKGVLGYDEDVLASGSITYEILLFNLN